MALSINRTSLSAGDIIYAMLSSDQAITSIVTAIYPVIELSEAVCPYISYRRAGHSVNPQKAGQPGADTLQIVISCYTEGYEEGVELAELVRHALDYQTYEDGELRMRGCYLTASSETHEGDAFIQDLTFTIKI